MTTVSPSLSLDTISVSELLLMPSSACLRLALADWTPASDCWRSASAEFIASSAVFTARSREAVSSLASTAPFPHGEEKRITWWDAVDYIGIQAYYKLTTKNDPTVGELKEAWVKNGHIALLEDLSRRFNKPIIFTEIGYRSIDGTNKQPANSTKVATIDLQEQADCYQAALEVLWGKPWLAGMFWWQWRAEAGLGGPNDTNAYPNGKPAEEVLKKFYLSPPR